MTPPAAVPKTTRLTSRAAVLAVVICAIALSLAYPVREYIAQRRQIDELVAEQQIMQAQVKSLIAKRDMYSNPAYIEQMAEQELHMCLPSAKCYVIENGQSVIGVPKQAQRASAPWYSKLWQSVEQSDSTAPAVRNSPATRPLTEPTTHKKNSPKAHPKHSSATHQKKSSATHSKHSPATHQTISPAAGQAGAASPSAAANATVAANATGRSGTR